MDSVSPLSDEQIAIRIQNGEREEFGTLMERYEKKLTRYGSKFLARQESIEDSVQEIFIRTFQNIQSFDSALTFSSWIYRIAHNVFVNELKKQQKAPLLSFDLDILVSPVLYNDPVVEEREYKEIQAMITAGLAELPQKYKEVIVLHYLEEFSYKKISDILQIPTGTVGVRIKRAREALKKVYEKMQLESPYE